MLPTKVENKIAQTKENIRNLPKYMHLKKRLRQVLKHHEVRNSLAQAEKPLIAGLVFYV